MPQIINKYRVFLASPSDLNDEREAIDEVVTELNLTYGNSNNIVIELLKWENTSAPAISNSHVQDIITGDIGEYDLFIGLIWKKFGTPTKFFGSGTEEEFNNAYSKFINIPSSVQILFYFKNAPFTLDEIDPEQLVKIKKFKESLGDKNVLYWDFSLKEDLQRFLRIHIPRRIDDLKLNLPFETTPTEINKDEIIVTDEEELGTLDYQELYEDGIQASTLALTRISEATSKIGEEFNKKTNEINILLKTNNQPISSRVQRGIYNRMAKAMDEFASRIAPEIPIYKFHFETAIDSFSKLLLIYKTDFTDRYENEIDEAIFSLSSLLGEMETSLLELKGFRSSLQNLPRVSKELNKARNNVVEKLSDFLSNLEGSYSLANEIHKDLIGTDLL